MNKTIVGTNKAKSIPHPKVGENYAPGSYNNPKEKGTEMSFIPKKVDTKKNK